MWSTVACGGGGSECEWWQQQESTQRHRQKGEGRGGKGGDAGNTRRVASGMTREKTEGQTASLGLCIR
ncbi:hypothetical protein AHAS_Ahas14G0060600 [Arachis hypogaea]